MMTSVLGFMAEQPLVLLFLVMTLGAAIGRLSVAGVGLGAAAVLFVAIGLTAWGTSVGVTLAIPEVLGTFGLAVFAFATGMISGPGFFGAMRSSWPLMLAVAGVLAAGAATAFGIGRALGLTADTIAGTFAGALTNTPALAAAGGTPAATVGYASAYVGGVLGMLVVTVVALRRRRADTDAPAPLIDVTVRVDTNEPVTVADLRARHGGQLMFSRIAHQAVGPIEPVDAAAELHHGDVVTVVGPRTEVETLIGEIGHRSSHDLTLDRSKLDFRRITLSNARQAGRTVAELGLEGRFGARVARVRRGDVDIVSTPDLVLQLGDRLRVVAPTGRMSEVTRYLGDSTRGLTELNPAAFGLGLLLGMLLGEIPVPLPGGGTFTLGAAAGSLLVGLLMGRVGRVGRVLIALPYTVSTVVAELGLLLFLTYAGTKAGSQILAAFASGEVAVLAGLGAAVTAVVGIGTYLVMRRVFHTGGTRLSGILAGTQTQPALLGYANTATGFDPRVALGYALVYPTAMVVKILLAQLLVQL